MLSHLYYITEGSAVEKYYSTGGKSMEMFIAIVMAIACGTFPVNTPSERGDALMSDISVSEASVCCPQPSDGVTGGDILFISRPEGFVEAGGTYDRVVFEEKWSSPSRLCFRAEKSGKDNILVTWMEKDTLCTAEYIVDIDDDLNITLADIIRDPVPLY